MAIGDMRPQDLNDQPQEYSPNDTISPAQGLDQDNHEEEDEVQVQEESNDQGGDEDDEDKEEHNHIQECATMFK
jgi:hypothetical protein